MRIAFYAPMKAPDHPTPSGDRRMAQLLMGALEVAGHRAEIVSRFRSYLREPDLVAQRHLRREAEEEVSRLTAGWNARDSRPDVWFSYHNYHKAPDLLGPALARRLGIRYVLAEASRSPRRAAAWADWYAAAEAAIKAADLHFCFTARDRSGIEPAMCPGARAIDLPPFVDSRGWPLSDRKQPGARPVLITVAMMRAGDKLDSYRLLAAALTHLEDLDWDLSIVGDGSARPDVASLFGGLDPSRLRWTGLLSADAVRDELARSDLYVWPGFGEAFGLGYLEAQAMGLPVAALDVAGVRSVVRPGVTGLLVSDPSPGAFAAAVRRLLVDADERGRMGRAAAAWVRNDRTIGSAAQIIHTALESVLTAERPHVVA